MSRLVGLFVHYNNYIVQADTEAGYVCHNMQAFHRSTHEVAWAASLPQAQVEVLPDTSVRLFSLDRCASLTLAPCRQLATLHSLCRVWGQATHQTGDLHWLHSLLLLLMYYILLALLHLQKYVKQSFLDLNICLDVIYLVYFDLYQGHSNTRPFSRIQKNLVLMTQNL